MKEMIYGYAIETLKDGLNWNGRGSTLFTTGSCITYNQTYWVAGGNGTNSLIYSTDGITWTACTGSVFTSGSGQCLGITWNGNTMVAVGYGGNTIIYSTNGTAWSSATNIFANQGNAVTWNGTRFIAVGQSVPNTIATSKDGITWYTVPNSTNIMTSTGNGVSSNTRVGAVIVDSSLTVNSTNGYFSKQLGITSDYYNNSFNEFSTTIKV